MNRVIGTVPNINYPSLKDYVVEYNGDWWVGRVTVYRSLSGARCPYESEVAALVNAAAGRLKINHYSYTDIFDMYQPVKDGLEIKRKNEQRNGLLALVALFLLPIISYMSLK